MIYSLSNLNDGLFYLCVDDYLQTHEYNAVWEEVRFLSYDRKMTKPGKEDHSSAKNKSGESLATRRTVFLSDVYKNNIFSNYLHVYKNYLHGMPKKLKETLSNNPLFNYFLYCNKTSTLLNYYNSNQSLYKAHTDRCIFTQIYWIMKENNYEGGDLILPDLKNHKIQAKNNRMILFPSIIKHEVTALTFSEKNEEYIAPGRMHDKGRYSLVTFYNI